MARRVLRARAEAPVFADAGLSQRMPLHTARCGGRLDNTGRPRDRPCRCRSGRWTLELGLRGAELARDGSATLVAFPGYGPCWVERKALVAELGDPRGLDQLRDEPPGRDLPPDLVQLREHLEGGMHRWQRRRIRPKGGDLVFVRIERDKIEPFRFLCTTRRGGQRIAVLLDPELQQIHLSSIAWNEARYLELGDGEPWQKLYVAYPLSNGVESPGW